MKIHHIRNATFIIEAGDKFILVDPMLGPKGSGSPLAFFRFKALRNPTVELPSNTIELLENVTHCLITHLHRDHIDKEGIKFLVNKKIPIICSYKDQKTLKKKGLMVELICKYWKPQSYVQGEITGIPATHGYGFVKKIAGPVMGFYMKLPNDHTVYISSDTVYTNDVHRALTELKPDISILAAGMAQLDIGDLLLMNPADIMNFIQNAPGKVVANHLEALNHCPNSRKELQADVNRQRLTEKVIIPNDGETIDFS